jgi:DNA-binding response OmpR family regulator
VSSTREHPVVLVIDDDRTLLADFRRALALDGYDAHLAADASEANAALAGVRPDAILLDLHLPGIDGLELLRQIRARDDLRDVAVAVITADYTLDPTVEAELRALDAIVHYKPLWLEDLISLVESLASPSPGARA